MPENSGTGQLTDFPGSNPAAYYSTGLGGSAGIGTDKANLSPLASVVVTTPGASSTPPQPMSTVDAGDASVASQSDMYSGSEPISGVDLGGKGNALTAGQYNTGPYSTKHVVPVPGPNAAAAGHPNAGA